MPLDLNRLALAIESEDLRRACGWMDESHQEADGRRLSRAIWTQVAQDLALIDLEVEIAEPALASVVLAETAGLDRGRHGRIVLEPVKVREKECPCLVMVSKGVRLHAGSIASQKEVNTMNQIRRFLVGAAIAGSLLTGGVIGATLAGPLGASAATTTNVAATAASPSAGSGTFVSNETAAHEAGESAAREAQENAVQVPTVP
jgi:hypothetical protein